MDDYINNNKMNENKNKIKYKKTRINIDSTHRNKEPKNILYSNIWYLENNSIDLICNNTHDTDIVIHQNNHSFNINDNIIIQGVQSVNIILKNGLTFSENSKYVCVNHPNHNINFTSINKMTIQISNFIGNTKSAYNNIPINEINGIHEIIPTILENEITNNNFYYFKMSSTISNFTDTYNLSTITITSQTINGINLNLINANYPININQLNGFHTIYYTEQHLYKIKLNITNNISTFACGLNNIWIGLVIDFIEGFESNNSYKIELPKAFYNVSRIKLISSEFPNTEKIIKILPSNKHNNMFYWKIFNDGDYLYQISLPSGNYSVNLLQSTLKKLIDNTPRQNLDNNYNYLLNNECVICIEEEVDIFNIIFYSTIFYPNAISYRNNTNYADGLSRLVITHPNHGLDVDCIITIINAIGTDNIPIEILNNTFKIESIINGSSYQVILPKYNLSLDNTITNGGIAMGIKYPIKSQLLFTTNETIGSIIGFRNCGSPYSYTGYNFNNSNINPYLLDIIDNNSYINNSINLTGDNYILMTSNIYNEINNTGHVHNIFAKLLCQNSSEKILYNQYIQLCEFFNPPLSVISIWEVSFHDIQGNLYNFGNLEHSYTLEIYEEL